MIVFLDESGDAGFKLGQGSSRFFVIALVVFDTPEAAEETADIIRALRRQLQLRPEFEFKFGKMNDVFRFRFLEAVQRAPFQVRALVVDKQGLADDAGQSRGEFYFSFVRRVLKHNQDSIRGAQLRVDGAGGRAFRKKFSSDLRRDLGPVLADCKFRDSGADDLIQLADMMAGAVRRAHDLDKQDRRFYDTVRHQVADVLQIG